MSTHTRTLDITNEAMMKMLKEFWPETEIFHDRYGYEFNIQQVTDVRSVQVDPIRGQVTFVLRVEQ